jgi:PAS domain S-box-containing protein
MIGGKERVLATDRDITERKQAEEELRHLRNYLSNIIDSMPSMLVGVDIDGRVTQWNKTAEQTTGIAASAAQGKTLSDVIPQMALETQKIAESIRTRQIKQEQKRSRHSEHGTRFEDVTIYPLITNGVEGAVIRIDDVTDKVRMEEMMIQSEKMLSVGGLAGMLQTTEVMGLRLADLEMPANRRAAEEIGIDMDGIKAFMEKRGIPRMITTINESGRRVANIVENMLNFARKSEAKVSSHNIEELLNKTLELAATDYDLKKHYDFKLIEIKKEYEKNMPAIPCEGSKIQQVLFNILRNGAQAMQEGEDKGRKPCFVLCLAHEKERGMVRIEIKDNGPGMNEETRKRVFEPFFTTKPAGTGLGLSVSYFIVVENHGGKMAVESRPGHGAKFIIRLPVGRDT